MISHTQFADFLIYQASFHHHVSFRRPDYGSWFIQELCEKIETSCEEDDINAIIMKTSRSVALEYETYNPSCPKQDQKKQMPLAQTTLIRQIFLKKAKANYFPPQIPALGEGNHKQGANQFSNPISPTPKPKPTSKREAFFKKMDQIHNLFSPSPQPNQSGKTFF